MINKNNMGDNDMNDNKNDIKVLGTSDSLTSTSNIQTQKNFSNEQDEESSSGSSPSTLKKRLQELPSTARSIDRTSLGHRIYNREVSHRGDSTINYIDLNEDKEEKNKIISDQDETSSISSSHRSQGARARRRAKIRSEILEEIDKSLAATRSSLNDFLNLIDKSDEEQKSTGRSISDSIESLESSKIDECKDLSMHRRQSAFLTEPLTSRSYYRDGENRERNLVPLVPRQSKSAKENHNSYDSKDNFQSNNRLLIKKRIELRPLKFGGYRPQTGVILNNPSSDSEVDSLHDVNNFVTGKIDSPVVNTELSTPVSNVRKFEEDITILPVLSARTDENQMLSSFRSFEETPPSRISLRKCNTINDNANAFFQNVNSCLEESLNNGDDIRKSEINSLSPRSTSTVSKLFINEKSKNQKSLDINLEDETRENSYKISDEMVKLLRKVNSKSADDLSTFPKRSKEQPSRLYSAKYYSHKENFVSTPRIDGQSPGRISNDYQREKTPSFLNVKLIEDLKALDASDNEDNITKVPILPLNSEDVSRSTSAGSKVCSQNRSLDRNLIDSRDKESSSIRFRQRSDQDNEKVETFKLESPDNISMLNRNWQAPISIESRNLRESYDELDVVRQSRRAYSAPCQNLSNENMQSMAIDMRRDGTNVASNLRGYKQDEVRCKSADLSGRGISSKQNFTQLSDSSYSSYLARSTGSLSYAEDYQTLSDPLEMCYSRDEEFNSNTFDYGMSYMYPRQSHLSVLQEESETRLEENGRSEVIIQNKESNGENVNEINEINENDKISTSSSKNRNVIDGRIEDSQMSNLIEAKDQTDCEYNKGDYDIKNSRENNEESDNSPKSDSLSDTRESYSSSTSISSRSVNSESNDEDDKVQNVHEEGNYEFQCDKSYDGTIDQNEYRSKKMYEDHWQINDENSKLQNLTSVQPEAMKETVQKVYDISNVSKTSCSTSRLHCPSDRTKDSPRFRNKKSQDRFPFTISETRSMISTSNKKQGRCENVKNKTRSLETFQNLASPVLKEFLKNPNEIVDCFNYNERQEQRNIVPKMKGLVRRFSKKFKISRKRTELDIDDPTTKVIYQNQECQIDSMPDSCSDDSSIKESRCMNSRSAKTRSSIVSSGRSLKKSSSLENLTLCTEYPRRRYDRDDLWVKELQKCLPKRNNARKSSKERFTLFSSKSSGSSLLEDSKRTLEKSERISCKKEDQISISKSCLPLAWNAIESKPEFKNGRNPDVDESSDDEESGCVCLKIFRMITCPVFVRSHDDSSIETRQRSKR